VNNPWSLTYNQDGLATQHNADFSRDPRFQRAYAVGVEDGRADLHIEWRVHVALWCATHAARLEGDFVECGVHTGILSGAVMEWLDFARLAPRRFWLFDTWGGIPEEQMSEAERRSGISRMNRKYQNGDQVHASAQRKFSRWPNASLVRGRVPESLSAMQGVERIAYVSMDLNVAAAEMGAVDVLWPRLVAGAPMLLDDYGWAPHIHQKRAWDEWARREKVEILSLPTGQGLVLK
jgi:O-methyltransferase